ncbi:glutaredoxin 3 [Cognatishimia sp.]|uniref:glutaredoxin 3 n=1 Tax=Cognatishimia sp. TaxID=2211648 RepID=UPI003515157A
MKQVEIYTRPLCGFCAAAKSLLDRKSVAYTEVNVWQNPDRKPEMVRRSGGRATFPQIFIDGKHVGGCDDLMALEHGGKLDKMLA